MAEKKPSGLQDVVVAESSICFIDGKRGQLVYRGYDIDDLADHSSFEEVAFLLWNGALPKKDELERTRARLGAAMTLPPAIDALLRTLPNDADTMRVLEVAAAALGTLDPDADDMSVEANCAKAVRLTAQLPLVTTLWHRLRQDLEPIAPDPEKSIAYNFLKTMTGEEPDEYAVRTFDVALILHADHELNASTFSARITASTLSDLYSAVVAAICTLKGPLHGGANEAVMEMLEKIGSMENVQPYVENLLANKGKIMGFGHRVYKAKDPRAKILEEMSEELGKRTGTSQWFNMTRKVEEIYQPIGAQKNLYPNVDFYSASAYQAMGIPRDLFTPIFACSRVVGWTAHLLEQYANNRIFRPSSDYVGPVGLKWAPIDERS